MRIMTSLHHLSVLFLPILLLSSNHAHSLVTTPTVFTLLSTSTNNRLQSQLFAKDESKSPDAQFREDPVVQLPLWEARLQTLQLNTNSNNKNDLQTLDLQSQIDMAKASAEFGVRKAQVQFYEAFSTQDIQTMRNVWSKEHDCQCIHPGMGAIDGRASILQSWEVLFQGESFDIEPTGTSMDICGSTAICRCVEKVGASKLEALNIYKREGGTWKMTLHMASPIAIMAGDMME